jgi:hypothetical protein
LDEIEQDMKAFIKVERWRQMYSHFEAPTVAQLQPWLRRYSLGDDGEVGVLESWNTSDFEYLVPHNGMIFKVATGTLIAGAA